MGSVTAAALTCSFVLIAASACGSEPAPPPVPEKRGKVIAVTAADPRVAARADTAFGLAVLDRWCRAEPRRNLVLSPSSLAAGVGMVALGARGETALAMTRALRLPPGDPVPALHARQRAMRGLNTEGVTWRVTDQVWTPSVAALEPSYLDRVTTAYDAGVRTAPFGADPEGARRLINRHVEQTTSGRIRDLIPAGAVTRDTGFVLTDAVYLKAQWKRRFDPDRTAPSPFTTAAGARTSVPMMSADVRAGLARAAGWTAVALPYEGGRLSLTALLPDARAGGCPDLTTETLDRLDAARKETHVALRLPKVDLKSRLNAGNVLTGLGMGIAFSDRADLTGISAHADRLQFVHHAAMMRVDEKGTEAAAGTAAGVTAVSAGPSVAFDRPHLLLVREQRTGEPLFLARVADPGHA
ncbi:serpin family protein [Actinomadura flavalba]|uniref:serpin family protein n=1 Tax=Actinomadura flavalba TaxID=1120938 RepID=UPI000379FEF2|nr:serpin family protein [Actinomadura flavalba]